MKPVSHEELTAIDVRAMAAALYEPQPRRWFADLWECPHCLKFNREFAIQCACGISRDGLPEFCER
jgi:hypothetical protein